MAAHLPIPLPPLLRMSRSSNTSLTHPFQAEPHNETAHHPKRHQNPHLIAFFSPAILTRNLLGSYLRVRLLRLPPPLTRKLRHRLFPLHLFHTSPPLQLQYSRAMSDDLRPPIIKVIININFRIRACPAGRIRAY